MVGCINQMYYLNLGLLGQSAITEANQKAVTVYGMATKIILRLGSIEFCWLEDEINISSI